MQKGSVHVLTVSTNYHNDFTFWKFCINNYIFPLSTKIYFHRKLWYLIHVDDCISQNRLYIEGFAMQLLLPLCTYSCKHHHFLIVSLVIIGRGKTKEGCAALSLHLFGCWSNFLYPNSSMCIRILKEHLAFLVPTATMPIHML